MGRVGGQCPVMAPSTWSEPTAPGEGSQALAQQEAGAHAFSCPYHFVVSCFLTEFPRIASQVGFEVPRKRGLKSYPLTG